MILKNIFKMALQNELECYSCICTNNIIENFYEENISKFNDDSKLLYTCFEPKVEDSNKSPICLVAHIDTVNNDLIPPKNIVKESVVVSSTEKEKYVDRYKTNTGKVFDDRAGIGIILSLLEELSKYNIYPYIIITGQEEKGCVGALELTDDYSELEDIFPNNNIQMLLEIDKAGDSNICFYDLEYYDFERLFSPYFTEVSGTFSDISVLCPNFDIAGANVSAGYYCEHTTNEYITKESVENSFNNILYFIKDFQKYNGNDPYEYICFEDKINWYCDSGGAFNYEDYYKAIPKNK